MKSRPKASWLLPVKNGMPYLPATLASLEAQTCRDFEVLVWVNGSTDGTLEELKRWIPDRLPGRIVEGQPRGVGGALAGLVELSQADICLRLDADDLALPERMEIQLKFLEANPDVTVVGSQMKFIDAAGRDLERTSDYPLRHENIVIGLLTGNPIGHPSVAFRRAAILAIGNYRDIRVFVEDYDLWLRLAPDYKFNNLPEVLISYRLHDQSTTREAIRRNELKPRMDALFIEHAGRLFDWDPATARKFQTRQLKWMFISAGKLARHRARLEKTSFWRVYCSPGLIDAWQGQVHKFDVVSGCIFACLDPRTGSLRRFVGKIVKRLLSKLPGGTWLSGKLEKRSHRRKFFRWLKAQRLQGSNISKSIVLKDDRSRYSTVEFGPGIIIEQDVTIWLALDTEADPRLQIGAESFVGLGSYLGVYYPVRIGKRVLIGARSYIISANHTYQSRDRPIREQGYTGAPIVIEDDVWLGAQVIVLPGVTIGRGAIVGAGAVVTKSIPAWEIWGGVPARFLKTRP